MNQALRQTCVIQPGGVIEIQSPDLPEGAVADVIVILGTPPKKQRSLTSFIGTAKGGFATPKEADEFISRDRDSWLS